MGRIGILTHHYVKNYGAFLQAYALTRVVGELSGEPVCLVNYINSYHLLRNIIHVVRFRRGKDDWSNYCQRLRQCATLARFEKTLPRTQRVRSGAQIDGLGLDRLIIGSDEVWDFEDYGYAPVKFGCGVERTPLAVYAPSVGRSTHWETLPPQIQASLKRMEHLSSRDAGTDAFVRAMTGRTPLRVLDPALLYDYEGEVRQAENPYRDRPYLLVYDCKLTEAQIREVRAYAGERGWLILGAGEQAPWYDGSTTNLTPWEWVSMFRYAQAVITGTFHGAVFSVKFRKNFVAYPTEQNRINKISSLLADIGLTERIISDPSGLLPTLESDMGPGKQWERVEELKQQSLDYLRQLCGRGVRT